MERRKALGLFAATAASFTALPSLGAGASLAEDVTRQGKDDYTFALDAPSWDPAGGHSPNTPFAAAMAQGGFALHIPAPELYYQLLPAHHVAIHRRRGVKIRGLWYDSPALNPYRDGPSTRSGRHRGTWQIHRDPRDARTVFFQDPHTDNWHTLPWTGLPPSTEVPAFTDSRVRDMLAAARAAGLTPRTDTELLPVLLDLLGAHVPVSTWPTLTKSARRGITRDIAAHGVQL
ncbi:hypothetical protein [Nocardia sp. NRRL S-836]|uniref:hypothetical protein n=1 Tax=Nocardia sp. NRRL S-836 TaxID=1519492 RepID=UPI0006AF74F6|nr:hypothetical protein [Nocardia sp. NRRL S-836]KOV83116.1 hypothetical protein ADL03_21330 [Nocardia sp. NRRL S-836]